MEYFDFRSPIGLYVGAAKLVVGAIQRALSKYGAASLMLSGGQTPRQIVPLIASCDIDWSVVTIYASDERCVPLNHPDSTGGMIREIFESQGKTLQYLHPPEFDEAGARAWWRTIKGSPPLAASLLGIGTDGHTASLFPGRPEESIAEPGAVWVPETLPHSHARITLTSPCLSGETTVLLAGSQAKMAALASASERDTPISRILRSSREAWILSCDHNSPVLTQTG